MTGYMYAYNPCSSFILPAPKGSDNGCLVDVAVSFCIERTKYNKTRNQSEIFLRLNASFDAFNTS